MNLTLNDFRNVLGKVNDGNVVFAKNEQDEITGIKKVNYGRVFLKEETKSGLIENVQIREAFFYALSNSAEGKLASRELMNALRTRLGLDSADENVVGKELTRREIKQILNFFDSANAGLVNGVDCVVDREIAALIDAGIYDGNAGDAARNLLDPAKESCMALFRNSESMKAAFGADEIFNGFSRAQIERFIDENGNRLRLMAFDRLYWEQIDDAEAGKQGLSIPCSLAESARKPDFQRKLLRTLADQLMGMYGRHEEISTRSLAFIKCAPVDVVSQAEDGLDLPVEKVTSLLKLIFPDYDVTYGNSVFDAAQNEVLRNASTNTFANVFRGIVGLLHGPKNEREANARTEFVTQHPELSNLLDAPVEVFDRLGRCDRELLGAALRGSVLAQLKTAGGNPVPAETVLRAVASALQPLTSVQPERILLSLLTTMNDNRRTNLDEHQLKEIVVGCGDLIRSECLRKVQTAMLVNVAQGLPVNTGLAGTGDFTALVKALTGGFDAKINGPKMRNELLTSIGKLPLATFMLPVSMRKPDPDRVGDLKECPKDDNAAMIGAKCAFLATVMGSYHPDLAGLIDRGQLVVDEGLPDEQAEQNLAKRLEKIDELVNRFSTEDINDTKVYLEKDLGPGAGDLFYRLFRDKRVEISDLSGPGCYNYTMLKRNGMAVHLPKLMDLQAKTVDEAELKAVHEMFSAMFIGAMTEDYRAPKYENRDSLNAHWQVLDRKADDVGVRKVSDALMGDPHALDSISDAELIGAMTDFGIGIKDLDTFGGAARAVLLLRARVVHGNSFAGLGEWLERISGINVRTATLDQLAQIATAIERASDDGAAADPLQSKKISAGDRKTIDFLEGKLKIEEFALDVNSMRTLLTATRALASAGTVLEPVVRECTINGTKARLSVGTDGVFRVRVILNGRELPITTSRSAADIRDLLETRIANHPDEYGKDLAGIVLPRLVNGKPEGCSVTRARELCVKTIVAKIGAKPVAFAAMGLEELVACARGALAGTYTLANVPKDPPAVYNSADVVVMQQAYADADDSVRALVKLPNSVSVRDIKERKTVPPSSELVHTLISELVMNLDTAVYDRDAAKGKGERLQAVLRSYEPELGFVKLDVDKYVSTLPETVRGSVKALLEKVLAADVKDLGALAQLEDDIAKFTTDTMIAMQARITALFEKPGAVAGEQGPAWTRSLEELANVNGLDPKSPNGKFVLDVLKKYFKSADVTEKRSMLSAFLRNTFVTTNERGEKVEPSIGKQAGELMKGAGPVFQKMLQGLPIESFSPETQAALRDMKSRLAPIPEQVVRAQLLNLIQSSNGNILSIEVKKTLGCATVGQALLCHIKTKEHPFTGEDVVIKLLRPNVQTAALREFKVISQIAEESGGKSVAKTFEGQFATILRELDFTLEAENIDVGKVHYDRPTVNGKVMPGVRSMGRSTTMPAATNALVLEKVSGDTLDGTLTKCADKIKNIKLRFERKVALNENEAPRTVLRGEKLGDVAQVRCEMSSQVELLLQKRGQLEELLSTWLNEALFGSGFFHGDMHAGNVMSDDKVMTFIDFGNVTRLSPNEQKSLTKLVVAAGNDNKFYPPAEPFLAALDALLDADGKKALKDERESLKQELTDIMKLGASDRLISKVFAALAAVQRHKVPLPEGINAFVQSLSRLKGAMSQIDDLIEESRTVYERMEHGPDVVSSMGLEKFKGKVPFIEEFIEVVRNGGRNTEKGLPTDRNKANLKKLHDYNALAMEARKTAIRSKTMPTAFPGEDFAAMKPFGEDGNDFSLFEQLAKCFQGISFPADRRGAKSEEDRNVQSIFKNIEKAKELAARKELSDKEQKDLVMAKYNLINSVANMLESIAIAVGSPAPIPSTSLSPFEQVVADCLSGNIDEVQAQVGENDCIKFALGSMFIDGHIKAQRKLAQDTAVNANRQLVEDVRIGELRQQKLLKVLKEFRFPNGPAGTDDLSFETAVQALKVNLRVARQRLGLDENERMSEGELRFMANYLKTLHQVKDEHWFSASAYAAALASMGQYKLSKSDDPPYTYYTVNTDELNPVMRAVNDGGELPANADQDLVSLVNYMRE